MIKIIDYGLGNIQAFLNIYHRLCISVEVAKTETDLEGASKLILPGVGHFDYAIQSFTKSGMRNKVEKLVFNNNIPILGVCVGMQIMANSSEEGIESGLGWIDGKVKSFKSITEKNENLPLPHMGWNTVITNDNSLFEENNFSKQEFYFLHSYYFDCVLKKNCIGISNYGSNFCSIINDKNIFGVQFHPEKSHNNGVNLLKKYSELKLC